MNRLGLPALLLAATLLPAAEPAKIGDTVGRLSFTDIRSLPRTLDDFGPKKAYVLAFTNTTCPLVRKYLPTLQAMSKKYPDVQFACVNVAEDDTIIDMATQAVQYDVEFPFVKDFGGAVAKSLGVKRTPEVVVLNAERVLVYRGRIDDQYRLRGTRSEPTAQELKAALDAVLGGQPVAVSETEVDGCAITFPVPRPPAQVTFAEHVAPILQKHCWSCHQTNGMAPFSLTSHHHASNRAAVIAEAVADQRMPPWFASDDYGPFTNRRALSPEERQILDDWSRSGAPLGDAAKVPEPPKPPENEWTIGEPDMILKSIVFDLPATGDIDYKYAVLPHIFTHDTWIKEIQILPDNPRVLHHCNMAYGSPLEKFSDSNFITGQVPGGEPVTLDPGTAVLIPAGSLLGLQIHFVSTGKPEKCRIRVGLRHPREVVQRQLRNVQLATTRFAIPPGAAAHKVKTSRMLEHDVIGVGLFAHMHLRGKAMSFAAHTPDGKNETLLIIPNYNFSWQIPYRWQSNAKQFSKGTRIEATGYYDNSPFNPYNPDHTITVRNGPQTHHEMMVGFFFYTHADEQLNLTIDPKTGRALPGK